METLPQDFIDFVRALQKHAKYEAHSYKLAKALGMRVRLGMTNYAMPAADDRPIIVLSPWYFGGNNDVTRHEIGHVMLYWSGLERLIIQEHGLEEGMQVIERLCQQAVAFLQITQPMVDEAISRHGVSAQAVSFLQKLTGATPQAAMSRLIYDDPNAERAGFITSGNYIAQIASCNLRLPFWLFDRVPEPHVVLPGASLLRLPHGGGLLGMLTGGSSERWYWEGA